MIRDFPGVFVVGEMIDWEPPTGGYLLQGCFATGDLGGGGGFEVECAFILIRFCHFRRR